MEHLNREEIGATLKKIRKEQGLSIDNVAKMMKNTSSTTLSNIERGFTTVGDEFIRGYCDFLNIPFGKLPSLIEKENIEREIIQKKLLRIEKLTDLIDSNKLYKKLKDIPIPQDTNLKILYYHLEGRCFYYKRMYEKASIRFSSALQILNNHPEMEYTNIRAACYVELGRIAFFHHNNLEQALHLSELGLKAYRNDGLRQFIRLSLLSGKASYLEKMHRDEEAFLTVEEILKEKNIWHRGLDSLLNAIEIKALLCAKKEYYQEAFEYAEEGVELARLNKHYSRSVELMTALGDICFSKNDYHESEEWYLSALQLEKKIKQNYLFVTTHTKLGILYMALLNWEKAKSELHKAVLLGEENDDRIRYYSALISLGDFYIRTHNSDVAIQYLETARTLFEKNNFPFSDPRLYLRLSHCYEQSNPEKSKKYLAKYKSDRLEFN